MPYSTSNFLIHKTSTKPTRFGRICQPSFRRDDGNCLRANGHPVAQMNINGHSTTFARLPIHDLHPDVSPAPAPDAGQDVQYHTVYATSCDSYIWSITVKPTQARRSIFLTIILPTVFAFLLAAGFGTLFLVWLFAHRSEYQYPNDFLLVNEH
ncbi:hypothetical protein Hypma_002842 [Hypsizygus marmoreus]|uniref:Uncharacterized protein n=1 Tax=Hypsizygus marmoreus TaxID=39966 RepID=A0A369J3K4_HYPMA|nr:hypothetical protein Hypma_002842 [Hypsizygus marmoreus]